MLISKKHHNLKSILKILSQFKKHIAHPLPHQPADWVMKQPKHLKCVIHML